MASWRRNRFTTFDLSSNFNWEDAIAAGNSYLRVHLRWGFHLDAPLDTDLAGIAANLVSFGLVTTVGNGTETRPSAASAWPDADPPTQRWIFWETRSPRVTAIDNAAGVVTFGDSGSTELTSTKGQVLAAGIPSGDSLNLSSCWAATSTFDSSVNTMLWCSMSILRKN